MAGGGCLLLSLLRLDSGGSAPARGFGKLTSLQFCPPLRLSSSVVHPLSIRAPRACPDSQLQLGLPAAPEAYYLPLLPSGPDGVRSASPRRAGSSTLLSRAVPTAPEPRAGVQPRYSGLRVQGTASSPSSTTADILSRPRTPLSRQIWQWKYGDVVELLSSSLAAHGALCPIAPVSAPGCLPLASQTPLM